MGGSGIDEEERARLSALESYEILDTPPEPGFDRVTRLASEILKAPISLVSLVDEHRQWFKSAVGLEASQTPRSQAFCAHAIAGDEVMVVEDASQDPRFAENPLVTGPPHIRFYAGAPLEVEGGHRLGTLCVIDREPRRLSQEETRSLRDLADGVVSELELRRALLAQNNATSVIEQRTRELERAVRDLEQFAYIASHDLQEPLRMVTSFGSLLRESLGEGLDAKSERYLEFMVDGATRMRTLIDDLLAFARLREAASPVEAVELSQVLSQVVADLDPAVKEAGASVEVGELPVVRGVRTQLAQLFQNLISNAVKFRAEGRAAHVSVSCESSEGVHRIAVEDNGMGFDPQHAERIFEPFARLHSRSEIPGSGIGLAICRSVVENHDGEISVESSEGEGARFVVRLPES